MHILQIFLKLGKRQIQWKPESQYLSDLSDRFVYSYCNILRGAFFKSHQQFLNMYFLLHLIETLNIDIYIVINVSNIAVKILFVRTCLKF